MTTTTTNLYLEDEENIAVLEIAEKWGLSKNNTIKRIIREYAESKGIKFAPPKRIIDEDEEEEQTDEEIKAILDGDTDE